MITRSVLLYLPGYPFNFESLTPRRRLASLAGSLLDAGHRTEIWDFGRVDQLDAYYPPEWRNFGAKLADTLYNANFPSPLMQSMGTMVALRKTDRAFRKRRDGLVARVADTLVHMRGLDFVALEINDREDLEVASHLLRVLRVQAPKIRTVAIGRLISGFPRAAAQVAAELDCLCVGEEEAAVVRWAGALWDREVWPGIGNLAYRSGDEWVFTGSSTDVDLGAQAEPAYEPDVYGALEGAQKFRLFELEDSRGCGCRCNGCAGRSCGYERLRLKPVSVLRDELLRLDTLYGARAFHFAGFGAPASHAVAIARMIERRGQEVKYSRKAHAGFSNPAAFESLRASGCQSIGFQIDTGSQRLLDDFYASGLQVSMVERVLRAAKGAGMYTVARLTFPAPDDDYHTRAETLRLLDRTKPDAAPVSLPEVTESSRWGVSPMAFGFRKQSGRGGGLTGRAVFPLAGDHWRLPGYGLGGCSASQSVSQLDDLRTEVAAQGIATLASERTALAAKVMGRDGSESLWTQELARAFMAGDWDLVTEYAACFNEAACEPAASARFTPLAGLRSAVGD